MPVLRVVVMAICLSLSTAVLSITTVNVTAAWRVDAPSQYTNTAGVTGVSSNNAVFVSGKLLNRIDAATGTSSAAGGERFNGQPFFNNNGTSMIIPVLTPTFTTGVSLYDPQSEIRTWGPTAVGCETARFGFSAGRFIGLCTPLVGPSLVVAVSESTGTVMWQFEIKTSGYFVVSGIPSIDHDGGLVFVTDLARTIYALSTSTGAVRWKYTIPASEPQAWFLNQPTVCGGTVSAVLSSTIRGLDARTGRPTWPVDAFQNMSLLMATQTTCVPNRTNGAAAFATVTKSGDICTISAASGKLITSHMIPLTSSTVWTLIRPVFDRQRNTVYIVGAPYSSPLIAIHTLDLATGRLVSGRLALPAVALQLGENMALAYVRGRPRVIFSHLHTIIAVDPLPAV